MVKMCVLQNVGQKGIVTKINLCFTIILCIGNGYGKGRQTYIFNTIGRFPLLKCLLYSKWQAQRFTHLSSSCH